MEQESTYVGIDVAKAQVDVAVRPTGQTWTITYDDAGIQELVSQLKTLEPALVLLEATGGLELPMVVALATAALPVVVVNPRQVRDFAKATGTLAKTDTLDAAVLAHFADAIRPDVRPLRDAETQVLDLARRHQVRCERKSPETVGLNSRCVLPYRCSTFSHWIMVGFFIVVRLRGRCFGCSPYRLAQ